MDAHLIRKYNIPGPRYTSYPTVPYWDTDAFRAEAWDETMRRAFRESNTEEGISLYIHLPYCESLCTFCACHKRITTRHDVESPYIKTVLAEWALYRSRMNERPRIAELHLGGGTPTFFSPDNLRRLIDGIFENADPIANAELSFEGHPNNTSREHLVALYESGFRRNSFGVQDYDPRVQLAINRIQPFENVKRVTEWSREIGYRSVSHDLVFGLPFQDLDAVTETIQKTRELAPDRIAFYSYAHVPWVKGVGQRGFSEADLPRDEEKRQLYETGKRLFDEMGYVEIGMDHFALPHDTLYQAMDAKRLHRNFMGYTSGKTRLMIGLGMSAISDSWYAFAQNDKSVEAYQARVERSELPVFRGHILNEEDLVVRRHILDIMCHFETSWSEESRRFYGLEESLERLGDMEAEGLIELGPDSLRVTDAGRPFVRNVCMAFDLHLLRKKPETRIFSMTV